MGSTWDGLGAELPRDPRSQRIAAILVRDARPPQPWWRRKLRRALHVLHIRRIEPLWTPFAADDKLRDDLFAIRKVDGVYLPNPLPNEGFHMLGTMSEDS
jgi:hypothetical protein